MMMRAISWVLLGLAGLVSMGAYLDAYRTVMLRDGGFPEVFDSRGRLLQTPLSAASARPAG
jgi:hypothetical protein